MVWFLFIFFCSREGTTSQYCSIILIKDDHKTLKAIPPVSIQKASCRLCFLVLTWLSNNFYGTFLCYFNDLFDSGLPGSLFGSHLFHCPDFFHLFSPCQCLIVSAPPSCVDHHLSEYLYAHRHILNAQFMLSVMFQGFALIQLFTTAQLVVPPAIIFTFVKIKK